MSTYFDSPVYVFLSQKTFSVATLINAFSRLSMLQLNKGNISYDDIIQTLQISLGGGEKFDEAMDAYGALLYEGILVPLLPNSTNLPSGPLLQIKRELVGNESAFIQAIVKVMAAHCGEENHLAIEEFENEAKTIGILEAPGSEFSNITKGSSGWSPYSQGPNGDPQSLRAYPTPPPPSSIPINSSYPPSTTMYPRVPPAYGACSPPRPPSQWSSNAPSGEDDEYAANQQYAYDIERQDPIVRLLAQMRKYGMDVLFPQIIHDKVCAVYISFHLIFLLISLCYVGISMYLCSYYLCFYTCCTS